MPEDTIKDPTDTGTLRPNAKPLKRKGTHFEPMKLTEFDPEITLPDGVDSNSPISIFTFYYSIEMIHHVVCNTNLYEKEPRNTQRPFAGVHDWVAVTARDIYIFLAIRIYMTLYPIANITEYWNTSKGTPTHYITKYMARDRFLELRIRFRIAPPNTRNLWARVEPLNQHIQRMNLLLWKPGFKLSIDESIIRFTGRAHEIVTIPNKPTPTGFKVWCAGQKGFLIQWVFHEPGNKGGPVGVKTPRELGGSITGKGGNKTQAVVVHLLDQLPKASYHVYLDNLFTSEKLLEHLRQKGHGATSTCRTNSGVISDLLELKKQDKGENELAWGTTKIFATESTRVNQIGWKDNAFVLAMSTVHDGKQMVTRQRKRPKLSSSRAKTARAPFGDQPTKAMDIPVLYDDYNY